MAKKHQRFNPNRFRGLSDPQKTDIHAPPIPVIPEKYKSTTQTAHKILVLEEWETTNPQFAVKTTEEWETNVAPSMSALTTEEWNNYIVLELVTVETWLNPPPVLTFVTVENWDNLGSWTFDVSSNEVIDNGTLKLNHNAGGSTTKRFGKPTGNSLNGKTINGIDQGRITTLCKATSTGGDNGDPHCIIAFRHIDNSNYYMLDVDPDDSAFRIIRVTGGSETTLLTQTAIGFTVGEDVWVNCRVTWWESAGSIFIRAEFFNPSTQAWTRPAADAGDTSNAHKGSTNKPAIGFYAEGIGSTNLTAWFDATGIYKV